MISTVEGIIRARDGNRVIVEVGGVGLDIYVPLRTLNLIGKIGEKVRFQTYLNVREDALTLYGFLDEKEKRLFQALLGVSGVGPKVALAILSVSEAGELARLIHEQKTKALMSFPGVGRKTAERIILELRDRIDIELYLPGAEAAPRMDRELVEEAVTALVTLGLSRAVAERAIAKVAPEELGSSRRVEDVVREVLKKV
ncbi:MAG: Holliday junction branch migration protein RuvA [Candidatus Krumholzibacteria bacterium]|nr:Holliday junction branch migration protein RuvA [Candidatus Krumholzibacteria bacterium]